MMQNGGYSMSFFELQLDEIAYWAYILLAVLLVFNAYLAYRSGFGKAKKRYRFYTPLIGDLPKGSMYEVLGIFHEEDETYLILHRVDGVDCKEPFLLRPTIQADKEKFRTFRFGDILRRGVNGLGKVK
jgi:hypothetical protein